MWELKLFLIKNNHDGVSFQVRSCSNSTIMLYLKIDEILMNTVYPIKKYLMIITFSIKLELKPQD